MCISDRRSSGLTLRSGSVSASPPLLRFNPRCHFSARISLSFASLVAYARQNLWLLRARDLGPAAAATSPHALSKTPICHAFRYSRFTRDFRLPSERRRRCHHPLPSCLPLMLKWNERQTAIFRRFAGWRWRVSERALRRGEGCFCAMDFMTL